MTLRHLRFVGEHLSFWIWFVLIGATSTIIHAQGYLITTIVDLKTVGLAKPAGIAADASGNVYVADEGGSRVWKITPQGTITVVAGRGTPGFGGDGGLATSALLSAPSAVAVDGFGDLYIADRGNARIRKVSAGGIITTVAGSGRIGFGGDGGPAISAQLSVDGIAVDATGNLYLSTNTTNGSVATHCVRKVTPQGIISTVAGGGTELLDSGGPATSAVLSLPMGLATDLAGSLYIADAGYNRIRKVTSQGIISTVVGDVGGECCPLGFSGDGGPATSAKLNTPISVAVDAAGNLYIVDVGNYRVRKVTTQGIISTVAGTALGQSGSGVPATAVQLAFPSLGFNYGPYYAGLLYGIAAASGSAYFAADDGVKELVSTAQSAQSAAGCVYSTDQNTQTVSASAATGRVGVLASATTCPWLANTDADWIKVIPTGVQNGIGVVQYTIAPNPNSSARTGIVWIAGTNLTVNQAGVACSLNVSPRNVGVPASGLTGSSLSVTANAQDCNWTATAGASWVLVTSGTSGIGSGIVTYTVGVNSDAIRTSTITVAGQKVYLNQAATGSSVSSLASINVSGVVNAASFSPPISSGAFVTIYGQNLADVTMDWSSAIMNGKLPSVLGGVQVLISGKNAFIYYVSPTQVNAIAQPGTATGPTEVDVISNHGTVPAIVSMAAISPGLFTYSVRGTIYAAALFNMDGAYVGAVGSIPGVVSRPAQAGDYLLLFATGLGQTNPPYPVGQTLTTAYPVSDLSQISVLVGGTPAVVSYAGMTYPGLFQINMQMPSGVAAGDQPIEVQFGGQPSQANVHLTASGN